MDEVQNNLIEISSELEKVHDLELVLTKTPEFLEYIKLKKEVDKKLNEIKTACKEYMVANPDEFDVDEKGNLISEGPLGRVCLYTSEKWEPTGALKDLYNQLKEQAKEEDLLGRPSIFFTKNTVPVCRITWNTEFDPTKESF